MKITLNKIKQSVRVKLSISTLPHIDGREGLPLSVVFVVYETGDRQTRRQWFQHCFILFKVVLILTLT